MNDIDRQRWIVQDQGRLNSQLLSNLGRDITILCHCGHEMAHHLVAHSDQPKESCTECQCTGFRILGYRTDAKAGK